MTQKNQPSIVLPIHTAREKLRRKALACSESLSRSVSRLTSSDAQPCLEYREEVRSEQIQAERLLYLQHCRAALERCIACGGAKLSYRRADGAVTVTRFRRLPQGRVKIWGLTA